MPFSKEMRSTVAKAPGNAIHPAASSIPLRPASRFPNPPANSTGSAPGVILAIKISSSYASCVSNFSSSTTVFCMTGINAFPPPNPIQPIFSIEAQASHILLFTKISLLHHTTCNLIQNQSNRLIKRIFAGINDYIRVLWNFIRTRYPCKIRNGSVTGFFI